MRCAPLWTFAAISLLLILGCGKHTPDPTGSRRYYGDTPVPDYQVRLGKQLFEDHCAVCHGDDGGGGGFNSYNLNPAPRDLTDHDFQESLSDDRMADAIRFGGRFRGGSQNMPAWKGTLTSREVDLLVQYIRTLRDDETGGE